MIESELPFPSIENFSNGLDRSLTDFWRWAYSDILVNTNRAILAEYLVACALGIDSTRHIEWNHVDLFYKDKKIEVKSSGYVQSWKQHGFSNIQFDIEKKFGWNAETGASSQERLRPSDYYVFVLYTGRTKERDLLLDITNWTFYPVATKTLDLKYPNQKSIGLAGVEKIAAKVGYGDLKSWIDN